MTKSDLEHVINTLLDLRYNDDSHENHWYWTPGGSGCLALDILYKEMEEIDKA